MADAALESNAIASNIRRMVGVGRRGVADGLPLQANRPAAFRFFDKKTRSLSDYLNVFNMHVS
jgi:hypothetical protein